MKTWLSFFAFLVFLSACQNEASETADLILFNGQIATIEAENSMVEALAIKDGKISFVGSEAEAMELKGEATKLLDLEGKFAMPGFIEGHGHFSGMGYMLIQLNVMQTKNWDEIVAKVAEKASNTEANTWIYGRGWHQEKWDKPLGKSIQGYPYHDAVSAVSPNNPVVLKHASGHALFANAKAMEMLQINKETPDPAGGHILRDPLGNPIGIFEERAMDPFIEAYAAYQASLDETEVKNEWLQAIDLAQQECLSKGISSFQDAGSSLYEIGQYEELAKAGKLDLRLWVMIREPYDSIKGKIDRFPLIDVGGGYLSVSAIKSQLDGALGARGAWLLEPYADKANFFGQNTTTIEEVRNMSQLAIQQGLQLCVHAIGDRANRELLDIYEQAFKQAEKEGLRWRVEHAQHVDVKDIPRFKELEVIASMQGIHCTSDAPFVVKRLGEERAEHEAYAWRTFLDAGVLIANGTDAPVEDVDPILNFYATVSRKRADSGLEFYKDQRMTREEALYSMTLANAYAGFEENKKGSLKIGKLADIVVLSENLLDVEESKILDTDVLYTIVGGKIKYQKNAQ